MEIIDSLRERSEISIGTVADMISQVYTPNIDDLLKKEYTSLARTILANMKDAHGLRMYYAVNRSGTYVNLDTTNDIGSAQKIEEMLASKLAGLEISHRKAAHRCEELSGQISMNDIIH